jgi:Lar family restriction alleviation protein
MTDDNKPDPKTEKGRAAISALAGIGRGCPFCGRREKDIRDWKFVRIGDTGTTQLECLGCGARGPSCKTGDDKGPDLLRALTAWNERQGEGGLLQERQRNTVQ